jgi:hypothetical protein
MKGLFSVLLSVVLTIPLLAQAQPGPRGLDESARKEIIRRGKLSQVVSDDIQDDGTARLCAAVGDTPALDNDKFNLTVLYGKFKNEQIDKLRADMLAADPNSLGAWVEVKNRGKGTYDVYSTDNSHLHVRFEQVPSPGDPDKWKGHDKFPTVVLQTPYSGRFGKPGLTIDFKVGYDGDQQALSDWLKESMERFSKSRSAMPTKEYVELQKKKLGHAQPASKNLIGSKPPTAPPRTRGQRAMQVDFQAPDRGGSAPFDVTPMQLTAGQSPSFPFPPNFAPTEPKVLTLAEIQEAAPGANADFVLAQLNAKVKTKSEVAAAWLAKKNADDFAKQKAELEALLAEVKKKPVDPTTAPVAPAPTVSPAVDTPSDEPAHPVRDWLLVTMVGLFGTSGVGLLVLKLALDMWRGPAKLTPSKVDDVAVAIGDGIVAILDKKLNHPAPAPSPKA